MQKNTISNVGFSFRTLYAIVTFCLSQYFYFNPTPFHQTLQPQCFIKKKKSGEPNYIYGSRIEIPCCLHHVHLCYEHANISAGLIISLAVSVMNLRALSRLEDKRDFTSLKQISCLVWSLINIWPKYIYGILTLIMFWLKRLTMTQGCKIIFPPSFLNAGNLSAKPSGKWSPNHPPFWSWSPMTMPQSFLHFTCQPSFFENVNEKMFFNS